MPNSERSCSSSSSSCAPVLLPSDFAMQYDLVIIHAGIYVYASYSPLDPTFSMQTHSRRLPTARLNMADLLVVQ